MKQAHDVVRRVEKTIRRHRMFRRGDTVIVGCSGGADSTCLLHVLTKGLASYGLLCVAVYVDHGLRPGTQKERDHVAHMARDMDIPFRGTTEDVARRAEERSESIQEAARIVRYEALRRIAKEYDAAAIAVGHTRSDQGETVLLQLLRGAGPKGLAGIAPVYGPIVRPLIEISREEVEQYCAAHGLRFITDPSNMARDYTRNRLRLDVMPLLKTFNPDVEGHLAKVADILREEEVWLDAVVRETVSEVKVKEPLAADGGVALDLLKLGRLPLGLIRRVIRHVYGLVRGDEKGLDFAHVERLIEEADLADGCEGDADCRPESPGPEGAFAGNKQLGIIGGVRIVREYTHLVFSPEHIAWPLSPMEEKELVIPGRTGLVPGPITIVADFQKCVGGEPEDAASVDDEDHEGAPQRRYMDRVYLDWEAIRPPIFVRSRRPGDRVALAGGTKKVKDILIDRKVPRRLRERIPLLVDRTGVFWVVGHGVASRVAPGPNTRKILRLTAYFN